MFDGFGNLYVFDRFQERVTSFSPQLELLETRSVPQRFRPRRALTLGPGNGVLVAASAYTEDLIGYPLHLLSDAFELVRSFGLTDADDQVVRPDMISLQLRNVAKAGVNLVWAAPYNEYSVQQWDVSTGARRLTIERTPDWFPSWYAAEGLSLGKPPQPIFRGIRQDHQGLLWTLVGVASEDWRSGIHTRDDGELELTARDAYRDTIIEIIDPSTFELLVSERLDEDITGFTNDGLMISNVGSNANPSVELLRAELHR